MSGGIIEGKELRDSVGARAVHNGYNMDIRQGTIVNGQDHVPGLVFLWDAAFRDIDCEMRGQAYTAGTFTRASEATLNDPDSRQDVTVGNNTPRIQWGENSKLALTLDLPAMNLFTYPRTLGSWSNILTPISAQDETGFDGVANIAWTITDDNASGSEGKTIVQTVTNDGTRYCFSAYVKKDNDETRFPGLFIALSGGTQTFLGKQINTKTGATKTEVTGITGTADDAGDFWRFSVTLLNNSSGNVNLTTSFFPARAAVLGALSGGAALGSAVFDGAQLETGVSVPGEFVTTTLATEAGAMTWTLPSGLFGAAESGTLVVLAELDSAKAFFTSAQGIISARTDSPNSLIYVDSSGNFATTDGTTVVSKDVTITADTLYKIAIKWGYDVGGTAKFNIGATSSSWQSSTWGTEADYDGEFTSTGSKLTLGHTLLSQLRIQKILAFNRVLSDVELEACQ